LVALFGRKNGATLGEIITATGRQQHTIRGFISILGKAGTKVEPGETESGAPTCKAA
jgi:hypothetical protein